MNSIAFRQILKKLFDANYSVRKIPFRKIKDKIKWKMEKKK